MAQLRRQLTEAKVSPPPDQIGGEAFDNGVQRGPAPASGQSTDPLLEPVQRRRSDPPFRHGSSLEAEAQELPAPFGLDDLFGLVVRPNKRQITRAIYESKIDRWRSIWPGLTILPWDDAVPGI